MLFIQRNNTRNQTTFRRSVRAKDGTVLKVLVFAPNVPLEVDPEDLPAIKDDVGKAIMPCEYDDNHQLRILDLADIDLDATARADKKKKRKPAPEQTSESDQESETQPSDA